MKYYTHNQLPISSGGTSLQGYLNMTYDELTVAFGKPLTEGYDDYKSDAEWHIQFEDGLVATIYNWKNGRNYLGDEGLDYWAITDWNIGGSHPDVVARIKQIVKEDITGKAAALPLP